MTEPASNTPQEPERLVLSELGAQAAQAPERRGPPMWIMALLLAVGIGVPFLTWYLTWFGRPLSDAEMGAYLQEKEKLRKIQHALDQLSHRIERNAQDAQQFYPLVLPLAHHADPTIRMSVAWVMQYDPRCAEFHETLLQLLRDKQALVRHYAALSLCRFGDAAARTELLAMLRPFEVAADTQGTVVSVLKAGDSVQRDSQLYRLKTAAGDLGAFAPLPGKLLSIKVAPGSGVVPGDVICAIQPGGALVQNALQGLTVIGTEDDILFIQQYESSAEPALAALAGKAVAAIRDRAQNKNGGR